MSDEIVSRSKVSFRRLSGGAAWNVAAVEFTNGDAPGVRLRRDTAG
jgi:hypothetical protein